MTIAEALASTGIRCSRPPFPYSDDVYVTYTMLGQSGMLYAEGKEQETAVTYVVNLYAKDNFVPSMRAVKAALEEAGYIVTIETEYYEDAIKKRHIVMTAEIQGDVYG